MQPLQAHDMDRQQGKYIENMSKKRVHWCKQERSILAMTNLTNCVQSDAKARSTSGIVGCHEVMQARHVAQVVAGWAKLLKIQTTVVSFT